MKGLTTIAALPYGAGCAAALPAERTFTLYPSVPKPLDVQIPEPPNWLMRAIVERVIAHPLKEWLQSEDGQKAISALKVPAVGKSSVECRATITPLCPPPAIDVLMTDEEQVAYRASGRESLGWSFTPNSERKVQFTVLCSEWESWQAERSGPDLLDTSDGSTAAFASLAASCMAETPERP